MTYKVGDRVVIIKEWDNSPEGLLKGAKGVVDHVGKNDVGVELEGIRGPYSYVYVYPSQLAFDILHNSPLMKALR